ncbi:uncharacterized protein LOC124429927 [Vespa crabro]|uniref:uncharacterized protein LOC124429927 n=1 Tax=Vespa crabro TaxID=7445 RepID=UPI001F02DDF2|nr:uncharacterized protein LOC124429927 [Vespa crabro]
MRKTEIFAKYFGQLINFPEPKHKLEFSETTENLEEDIPPNAEKIKEAIKNLKNNRGSGEYSITAEFLNWSLSKIIKELKIIFEDIWRTGRFPEEWKVALIPPLHKKGEKLNCDNYIFCKLHSRCKTPSVESIFQMLTYLLGRQSKLMVETYFQIFGGPLIQNLKVQWGYPPSRELQGNQAV